MNDKTILPIHRRQKTNKRHWLGLFSFMLVLIMNYQLGIINTNFNRDTKVTGPREQFCPIVDTVTPSPELYRKETMEKLLHDEETKLLLAKNLVGAIQIPTEGYDKMVNPNVTDSIEDLYNLEPLWKNFELLFNYLQKTYPLVHNQLNIDKVNKFGLVYTWQGSDPSKKPLMLTAHQDVVPVQKETIDQWDFPPFSGHIKDGEIYGRGVIDCKNLLIGLLDTVELLLTENFKPKRTVILAFGYDEESEGTGANEIGKFLLNKYGEDSMYQIIDEGSGGYIEQDNTRFIVPATAEKGHLDSIIEIFTPGGHSSVPPEHTSIGLLSELIGLIESKPFNSIITNKNPVLKYLQCTAEHTNIDKSLKSSILKAHLDKDANDKLLEYLSQDLANKYLVTTSQATDMIQGGAKANALPEHAQVLINQRIAVEEDVKLTSTKILNDIKQIATKYGLGVVFENQEIIAPTDKGYFNYTLYGALEPAPVTPTEGDVWDIFGGSLRYFYQDLVYPEDNSTYVFAPFLSTGNTDTKSYWGLTKHIYRYIPLTAGEYGGVHSVNERAPVDSHAAIVAFYYFYIPLIDSI